MSDAPSAPPKDASPAVSDQPSEPAPAESATLQARPDRLAPPVADGAPAPRVSDPLERVNRRLYAVDVMVGKAVARRPQILRQAPAHAQPMLSAVRNVLRNLDEPSVAANDLLQGKLGRALKSAARFVINSTLGVAGVSDAAERMGIERRDNDLDRTLARYGAPAGPYLYLPVAGPTTLRAAIGAAAEGYLYPPHWLHLAAGIGAALRGAGYAKLAQSALIRADAAPHTGQGRDGYQNTRRAYFEARLGPSRGAPGGGADVQMLSQATPPPQRRPGGVDCSAWRNGDLTSLVEGRCQPISTPQNGRLIRSSAVSAQVTLDARE